MWTTEAVSQIWGAGFYHQNDEGLSVKLGRLIPRGQWTTLGSR